MLCYTIIVLSVVMSDPRHTTICTLSLHDALPICRLAVERALQSGHCRNRLSAGVIGTRKSIRADPGRIVDRGVHIPATTTPPPDAEILIVSPSGVRVTFAPAVSVLLMTARDSVARSVTSNAECWWQAA